jgi:hypothetical protein
VAQANISKVIMSALLAFRTQKCGKGGIAICPLAQKTLPKGENAPEPDG